MSAQKELKELLGIVNYLGGSPARRFISEHGPAIAELMTSLQECRRDGHDWTKVWDALNKLTESK